MSDKCLRVLFRPLSAIKCNMDKIPTFGLNNAFHNIDFNYTRRNVISILKVLNIITFFDN